MKQWFVHIFLGILFLHSFVHLNAQNVMIDEFGNAPDNSAMLEIDDSLSGFLPSYHGLLIPRMTEAEKNAIAQPANGLIDHDILSIQMNK
jgi:hypothetical protein